MRLLDRYLLRELLIPLPYCLGGFLIFWISSELITDLDDFRKAGMGAGDVAEYYLARLPEYLVLLFPLVLLLTLLYAMTTHARHQEYTAMRAAGISLWRICAPYFALGLVLSGMVFLLNEQVVPRTKEHANRVRVGRQEMGTSDGARWRLDLNVRNEREERFWRIRAFNLDTGEMQEPYVQWRRADGRAAMLKAVRGEYLDGCWTFFDGQLLDPDPESRTPVRPFETLRVEELGESPEVIRSEHQVSRLQRMRSARKVSLTVAEIRAYKYLHPVLNEGERALLDTQLHARLAQPWTCLVVVLIAVPFGTRSGRRNAFVGVASSIFICVAFFVLQQLMMGLGTGQYLAPMLAGWLPNGVFGLAGLWLTERSR
jgi:lipopolysaccharide export system permease protein